jgi:hypothetical protein
MTERDSETNRYWSESLGKQKWEFLIVGAMTTNTGFVGGIPMDGIIGELSRRDNRKLNRIVRSCKDGGLKTRYLIVLNLAEGRSASDTARALNVSRSTVYRVAARFSERGREG